MNSIKVFINYCLNVLKKNKGVFIFLIFIICILCIRLPFTVYAPGGAINIEDRLSNKVYDSSGSLNLTYVTNFPGTIPACLIALVNPNWDLIKNSEVTIDNSIDLETMEKMELISLYSSVSNATYVAYSAANIEPNIKTENYYVYYVYDEADTTLEVGDRIVTYDGKKYKDADSLHDYITNSKVGKTITFDIIRNSEKTQATAKVKSINDTNLIGILVYTIYGYDNDPDIHYSYEANELGSSGGLMLSLAIYNALTEEDITNGLKIAGTGTIDLEGTVGEIGGIEYKIKGAVKNNCDVMLVPTDNYEDAVKLVKKNKYKIKLIEAKTFDQVIKELGKLK